MYDVSGEDEDPSGGSPPHGGRGGGGPVGEGGDGGEAKQPRAGIGEAGNGGEQRPEGGATVQGCGLHLEIGWLLAFPMPVSNHCSVMIGRILSKDLDG